MTPPTTVVNVNRQAYDIYVGRPGRGQKGLLGNPHPVGSPCPVCPGAPIHRGGEARELYRSYFLARVETDADFRAAALACRGLRLGCFCDPRPCHASIIAEWVDAQPQVK